MTFDQAVVDRRSAFQMQRSKSLKQFLDGASNTILTLEAGTSVPWCQPADLLLSRRSAGLDPAASKRPPLSSVPRTIRGWLRRAVERFDRPKPAQRLPYDKCWRLDGMIKALSVPRLRLGAWVFGCIVQSKASVDP